jgi:hypothetical protein
MRCCLPAECSVVLLCALVALVAELSASISFDDQDWRLQLPASVSLA